MNANLNTYNIRILNKKKKTTKINHNIQFNDWSTFQNKEREHRNIYSLINIHIYNVHLPYHYIINLTHHHNHLSLFTIDNIHLPLFTFSLFIEHTLCITHIEHSNLHIFFLYKKKARKKIIEKFVNFSRFSKILFPACTYNIHILSHHRARIWLENSKRIYKRVR